MSDHWLSKICRQDGHSGLHWRHRANAQTRMDKTLDGQSPVAQRSCIQPVLTRVTTAVIIGTPILHVRTIPPTRPAACFLSDLSILSMDPTLSFIGDERRPQTRNRVSGTNKMPHRSKTSDIIRPSRLYRRVRYMAHDRVVNWKDERIISLELRFYICIAYCIYSPGSSNGVSD